MDSVVKLYFKQPNPLELIKVILKNFKCDMTQVDQLIRHGKRVQRQ